MPAEVDHAQLTFVNGTNSRGFQSYVSYECAPGYVAVGRTLLMCDVDERWNGPPPRCDPVYCPEPKPIRNGGMSLSTNSTEYGSVLTYYCTSPRYVLVGRPKLVCSEDGSWNGRTPSCRSKDRQDPLEKLLDITAAEDRPSPSTVRPPVIRPSIRTRERKPLRRIPAVPLREKMDFVGPSRLPPYKKVGPIRNNEEGLAAEQFPIDNEILDANVQANPGQGADVPLSVQNNRENRQQQLNLGKTYFC